MASRGLYLTTGESFGGLQANMKMYMSYVLQSYLFSAVWSFEMLIALDVTVITIHECVTRRLTHLTIWHFPADNCIASCNDIWLFGPSFPLHKTTQSNWSTYLMRSSERRDAPAGRLTAGKLDTWCTARASNSLSVTTNCQNMYNSYHGTIPGLHTTTTWQYHFLHPTFFLSKGVTCQPNKEEAVVVTLNQRQTNYLCSTEGD